MRLKKAICSIAVTIAKIVLGMIYGAMKWLPTHNKVVFLSRQSSSPSLDYLLLRDELLKREPALEIVMITKQLEKTLPSALRFGWYSLVSMYHLATSEVCVLDTYWPVVSLLKHKDSLLVVQMWHAIGKLKQSGYQTLDKGYGRGKMMAELMHMHRGYDVVIAGGKSMNSYYCQSFGVEESQLYNIGLPRIDYLLENRERNRELLLEHYPELRDKTIVLYAPTFRRNTRADYSDLIARFQKENFGLIIKPHPYQVMENPEGLTPYLCDKLTTMQALNACDIVITDYSAISLEAAVLCKPIYFYLYDYQMYLRNNGVNINPYHEMPDNVYEDPDQMLHAIRNGTYDMDALLAFRNRYLPERLGQSTGSLAKLILDCIKDGKHEGIRKNLHRETEAGVPVGH